MSRVAFVPPGKFIGRGWYLIPRRITLNVAGRPAIYRWLFWNVRVSS